MDIITTRSYQAPPGFGKNQTKKSGMGGRVTLLSSEGIDIAGGAAQLWLHALQLTFDSHQASPSFERFIWGHCGISLHP